MIGSVCTYIVHVYHVHVHVHVCTLYADFYFYQDAVMVDCVCVWLYCTLGYKQLSKATVLLGCTCTCTCTCMYVYLTVHTVIQAWLACVHIHVRTYMYTNMHIQALFW